MCESAPYARRYPCCNTDNATNRSTDRIAYVLSLTGDLHSTHVAQLESSRKTMKNKLTSAPLESADLLSRRAKRVAVAKELHAMMPERAKAPQLQSSKLKELEDTLRKLEDEDKAREEAAAMGKRAAIRKEWEQYFDSCIEVSSPHRFNAYNRSADLVIFFTVQLGEKLALAARYGKLLAQEIPASAVVDPVRFPADMTPRDRTREATWSGAVRVAEIRAAAGPAVSNLQVDTLTLPHVVSAAAFADDGVVDMRAGTQSGAASSLGRSDTVSYGVSHAADLKADTHVAAPGASLPTEDSEDTLSVLNAPSMSSTTAIAGSPSNQSMGHLFGSSPSGSYSGQAHGHATGPLSAKINMAPVDIPASADLHRHRRSSSFGSPPPVPGRPQQHRVPPMPGQASHSPTTGSGPFGSPAMHTSHLKPHEADGMSSPFSYDSSPAAPGGSDLHVGGNQHESAQVAPDEPTVAETGSPIVGPGGPKTGYLPRRPSQAVHGVTGAGPSATGRPSFSAAPGTSVQQQGIHVNYYETTADARARKEGEAERERLAAAAAIQGQPEEDLPAYSERNLK